MDKLCHAEWSTVGNSHQKPGHVDGLRCHLRGLLRRFDRVPVAGPGTTATSESGRLVGKGIRRLAGHCPLCRTLLGAGKAYGAVRPNAQEKVYRPKVGNKAGKQNGNSGKPGLNAATRPRPTAFLSTNHRRRKRGSARPAGAPVPWPVLSGAPAEDAYSWARAMRARSDPGLPQERKADGQAIHLGGWDAQLGSAGVARHRGQRAVAEAEGVAFRHSLAQRRSGGYRGGRQTTVAPPSNTWSIRRRIAFRPAWAASTWASVISRAVT